MRTPIFIANSTWPSALLLSVLMFAAALACVVFGAAARNIAVVTLAMLVGSAVAVRRG
jgi:hypothetical protein